jgi:carboxypeptidase-like protein/carboxypeptidase family protein
MKKNLLIIIFILFAAICMAQTEGYIKGKITDTRSEPLNNVSVIIKELDIATHSDSTGGYIFRGIPEGEYTLWFSHFSYIDTKRAVVKVIAERVTNVNMSLLPFQEERYVKSRNKGGLITNNNNGKSSFSSNGILKGDISDKFGNPIMFADIRILETDQLVQSDDLGEFLLSDVSPGIYTVSFSKLGYEERRFIGVQVKSNETTRKKVKLSFRSDKK